jgi:hypothetical protein
MKEKTAWDRLRAQFKPDEKGKFKTTDAIKIAEQIDKERIQLSKKVHQLNQEIAAYRSHLRAVTSNK